MFHYQMIAAVKVGREEEEEKKNGNNSESFQ